MNTARPICSKCNMPFPPNNGADDGHIGLCDSCWAELHRNGKDCPDCCKPKIEPAARRVFEVSAVGSNVEAALDGITGGWWFAGVDVPLVAIFAAHAHGGKVFRFRITAELVSEYTAPTVTA